MRPGFYAAMMIGSEVKTLQPAVVYACIADRIWKIAYPPTRKQNI